MYFVKDETSFKILKNVSQQQQTHKWTVKNPRKNCFKTNFIIILNTNVNILMFKHIVLYSQGKITCVYMHPWLKYFLKDLYH